MCFHVRGEKMYADRDIPCWKVLKYHTMSGMFESVYNAHWVWGDLKEDRYSVAAERTGVGAQGEWTKVDTHRLVQYAHTMSELVMVINEGLHSYTSELVARENRIKLMSGLMIGLLVPRRTIGDVHLESYVVKRFYIPMGSEYYKNDEAMEYVSTRLGFMTDYRRMKRVNNKKSA